MPRPNPPPTPGSSSDIRGKEGTHAAPAFNLGPAAFQDPDRASSTSTTPSANGSDSSYRPVSPSSPAELSRKRSSNQSGSVITKDDFALPPPPTRSRKIIQMKPRESEPQTLLPHPTATSPQVVGKSSATTQGTGGKRKQNSAGTTAAGRKIARKTAHSFIERRRRSKMNEEFSVLKDMIPACKGQEMHKLAILQASIEYLRYLEQCVSDLQAQNNSPRPQPAPAPRCRVDMEEEDEEDEDEEMEDESGPPTGAATPAPSTLKQSGSVVSLPSLSQIMTTTTTNSPSIFSSGAGRHYSISSAASQASYSPYFHSNQTSPAFGPQLHHVATAPAFSGPFGLGSPALKPVDSASQLRHIAEGANELSEKQRLAAMKGRRSEQELDHEATAALLMLNNDRRNWRSGQEPHSEHARSSTGMSVRDLLSG